jgi:hypothetical protein
MHRCAYALKAHYGGTHLRIEVVDLTREIAGDADSRSRLIHVCRRVIDRVGLLKVLDQPAQEKLETKSTNIEDAFAYTADVLSLIGVRLCLLFPRAELKEELISALRLARPNIALFCESRDELAVKYAEQNLDNAVPLSVLHVGLLSHADAWKFVQARLQAVPKPPVVDKDDIDEFMRQLTARRRVSILELNKICSGVFGEALAHNRSAVTYRDFRDYYISMAAIR